MSWSWILSYYLARRMSRKASVKVDNKYICLDNEGRITICNNSIDSPKIRNGGIMTVDIADNAVTTSKIANRAITAAKVGDTFAYWEQVITSFPSKDDSGKIKIYDSDKAVDKNPNTYAYIPLSKLKWGSTYTITLDTGADDNYFLFMKLGGIGRGYGAVHMYGEISSDKKTWTQLISWSFSPPAVAKGMYKFRYLRIRIVTGGTYGWINRYYLAIYEVFVGKLSVLLLT